MIVFYTCLTEQYGFIPCIKDQKIDDFHYVVLHENHREAFGDKGWEYILLTDAPGNCQKRQRYAKMMPHQYFPEAEYTIYIDPSYYIKKDFYNRCLDIIKDKPNFVATYDASTTRTITEEALYAFNRGTLDFEDLKLVRKNIKDYFYSSNNSWLIRKNTKEVNDINEAWWNLYQTCYTEHGRDQLLLPSVCDEEYITWFDLDKELHQNSFIHRVDSPANNNNKDTSVNHLDVIKLFEGIKNSEKIFLRRI